MSRISIRFAKPTDAERFEADGVVSGPAPAGETWSERIKTWGLEQAQGLRTILVAEDASGLLGMVHLVFRFPAGYLDNEVANGRDVAMLESLRTRSNAAAGLLDKLVSDAQRVAKRHHYTTVTMRIPQDNERALAQAKVWGFKEFRLIPEGQAFIIFLRKTIV